MKILELCLFSAGADGVWKRVKAESEILSREHGVRVFSSSHIKGSKEFAPSTEYLKNIEINRFPALKPGEGKLKLLPGGESFMFWDFEGSALEFSPDVIIAHVYRHTHTTKALKIAKKLGKQGKNCRVFLVTHAPFARESSRSFISNLVVYFYDLLVGRRVLKQFDKIITITMWEKTYLRKLGVDEKKTIYIPNWINDFYFKKRKGLGKGIVYTGRISPIKNLETLIKSVSYFPRKILKIMGPSESEYFDELNKLIKELGLKNVRIIDKTFDKEEQISELDSSETFVLPSKTEGQPQSLLEAMARGRIVIASNNPASRDIIKNGVNGFLFEIGNHEDLKEKISKIDSLSKLEKEKIRKQAVKTASDFKEKNLRTKILDLIK